ncbi:MAG: flagellar export protein FliJ, partial [Treponemataceae bacterium]
LMKKFSFSLQKILELREYEENKSEIELARALSHAEKIKQEMADIDQQFMRTQENARTNFSMHSYSVIDQFLTKLNYRKDELMILLENAHKVIAEKQKIMHEAMKNRKIITTLKEHKLKEHKKILQQEEDYFLDDIASTLFEKKKNL